MGIAGARRLHPHAPLRRVDRRAGHAALRVVAADGAWRTACTRSSARRSGQIASAAVPRRRQRLVLLLDQLSSPAAPSLRSLPSMLVHARSLTRAPSPGSSRRPFAQLSDLRAEVARGPPAALPSGGRRRRRPRRDTAGRRASGADRRAGRARRRVLRLIAALSGAAYKMEMNLAQFYRRHLASRSAAATCRCSSGFEPPADRGSGTRSCRSTGGTRPSCPSRRRRRPADEHGRVVEAQAGGRGGGVRGARLVAAPAAGLPAPAGRRPAPRPDPGRADPTS